MFLLISTAAFARDRQMINDKNNVLPWNTVRRRSFYFPCSEEFHRNRPFRVKRNRDFSTIHSALTLIRHVWFEIVLTYCACSVDFTSGCWSFYLILIGREETRLFLLFYCFFNLIFFYFYFYEFVVVDCVISIANHMVSSAIMTTFNLLIIDPKGRCSKKHTMNYELKEKMVRFPIQIWYY